MTDDGAPEILSIGIMAGVLSSRPWVAAMKRASRRIRELRAGQKARFNVNVVFHLPDPDFTPEFEGLRSGTFSRRNCELMVQVAILDGNPKGDPDEEVRRLLLEAIDVAEEFARMEAVIGEGERLDELRAIVAAI